MVSLGIAFNLWIAALSFLANFDAQKRDFLLDSLVFFQAQRIERERERAEGGPLKELLSPFKHQWRELIHGKCTKRSLQILKQLKQKYSKCQ